MSNLILKGKTEVEGMKFNHIEGGFGEGKKSMLVKDVAKIHQREVREINQAINMNKNRFKNGIDVMDLKSTEFEVNLIDNGIYTQNALNRSNNIYLLSERGYSKLLKILEDDFAWDQYEKLVDGYFNMRSVVKENSLDVAKMLNQQVGLILGEVDDLNNRVDYLEDSMTVDFGQQNTLQNKTKSRVVSVLGGIKSHAYKNKSLRSRMFSAIWRDYKDYFNVASYRDTARVDFQKALDYLDGWQVQGKLLREIEDCNNQIDVDEIA
ncbi:MAG: hypothetical protein GX053_12665 [Tissierella sp.]|nr:hypothetical protein [Tissierella sp.]